MTYIPDLSTETYVPVPDDGFRYMSVGWLGCEVERAGPTDHAVIEALEAAAAASPRDWGPVAAGPHTCELCGKFRSAGEFVVEGGDIRYLLPNMVVHYVRAHDYRLPAVVERAILWTRAGP